MTSRERVLAALDRETPDRLPVDLWLVPELVAKFQDLLDVETELEVYRALGVDKIVTLAVPYNTRHGSDPNDTDQWGVSFQTVEAGENAQYREVASRPLADMNGPKELERYPWPDPDDFDYETAAAQTKELASEFVTLGPWVSLFEVYCSMRSLEEALIDTVANPEFLHAALDRIAWSQTQMLRTFLTRAAGTVDLVFVSDDMGTQQSLLISPSAFDEFILPRLAAWCDLIHDHGAKALFHTDGAAEPLIPRLIDAGVDVLNPIQHACPGMDRATLKNRYGDALIFHGGVDNQQVLPFGTPEQVADETRSCIETLGPDGYVPCSCHFIQADTPVENVTTMIETVQMWAP